MNFSLQTLSIDGFGDSRRLIHAFSPRHFISEEGVREELQLGRKSDPKSSANHQIRFLQSLGIGGREIYFIKQVHGDRVVMLDQPDVTVEAVEREEADALITHLPGRPIAVLSADCVPVILYDPQNHVAAVIHAGRKGTQMGIVSKTIAVLSKVYDSNPGRLLMAMGPAIGGCCYEVDEPCIAPFRKHYEKWKSFITPVAGDRFLLDLFQANEWDARNGGIIPENIYHARECTSCNNSRWFSYRKEGTCGRIVSLAMLLPGSR